MSVRVFRYMRSWAHGRMSVQCEVYDAVVEPRSCAGHDGGVAGVDLEDISAALEAASFGAPVEVSESVRARSRG